MTNAATQTLLHRLQSLGAPELRRLLVEHLTRRKLGLYWESDAIERDAALNADVVLPRHRPDLSHRADGMPPDAPHRNLLVEGDNFDALRLLKSTHAGRIRVIYIDPPYNTGNQDWVITASRKARRIPKVYGKVLFVTKDSDRLRIVNDDGSLGAVFDWDELDPAWKWMRETK